MPEHPRLRPVPPAEDTLVVVLRTPAEVIDRESAIAPPDAARVALFMIARTARLEAGDLLTVARADVDGTPLQPPRVKQG
ncbi:MAG TPA: hypothetical protein VKP67_02920 [Xanthobacteraceae bacterium]|nr:hypothetical protein [Xanthobacteraceae bacterium]